MTDRIDQLEFRWQPGYDLSAIASSDLVGKENWDRILRDHVGMPNEQEKSFLPTSSAVYITTKSGKAALVVRAELADALEVARQADPERRKLVARALVGDARALTPQLALCLACSEVSDLLDIPLGEVAVSTSMRPLSAAGLWAKVECRKNDLNDRCRQEPRLPLLIAARLERQGEPLNVLLDPQEVSRSLYTTPAIPLLWGLFQTTQRLLEGTPSIDHRSTSFTTFEPPFRDTEGRQMPHIVFQGRAGRKPPSFAQVSLVGDSVRSSPWNGFATGLAAAYAELGTDLDHYLDKAAARGDDLGRRAEFLVSCNELSGYWEHLRKPHASTHSAREGAFRQTPSSPKPVTSAERFSPSPTTTGPHTTPYRAQPVGIELQKLYRELNRSARQPCFGEAVLLVVAKVQAGHALPAERCHHVLGEFRTNNWYLDQLHQKYDGQNVVRMLGLAVQPVLRGLLQHHPVMFQDLSPWRDLPSEVREAMCTARARIPDNEGGLLLEEFLFRLLGQPSLPPLALPSQTEPAEPPPPLGPVPAYGISSKNIAIIAAGTALLLTVLLLTTLFTE